MFAGLLCCFFLERLARSLTNTLLSATVNARALNLLPLFQSIRSNECSIEHFIWIQFITGLSRVGWSDHQFIFEDLK